MILLILEGIFNVETHEIPTLDEINLEVTNVKRGGWYRPSNCKSRQNIAVVIPYRDRDTNLRLLLRYLHPLLQRQARSYRIVLVEQVNFNLFHY